jgi:hypothetical protein
MPARAIDSAGAPTDGREEVFVFPTRREERKRLRRTLRRILAELRRELTRGAAATVAPDPAVLGPRRVAAPTRADRL